MPLGVDVGTLDDTGASSAALSSALNCSGQCWQSTSHGGIGSPTAVAVNVVVVVVVVAVVVVVVVVVVGISRTSAGGGGGDGGVAFNAGVDNVTAAATGAVVIVVVVADCDDGVVVVVVVVDFEARAGLAATTSNGRGRWPAIDGNTGADDISKLVAVVVNGVVVGVVGSVVKVNRGC